MFFGVFKEVYTVYTYKFTYEFFMVMSISVTVRWILLDASFSNSTNRGKVFLNIFTSLWFPLWSLKHKCRLCVESDGNVYWNRTPSYEFLLKRNTTFETRFQGFKKTFLCYQPQNQITIKSHCDRVQVEILGKSRWIVFGASETQDWTQSIVSKRCKDMLSRANSSSC